MNFSSPVPSHIRPRPLLEYLAGRFTYHSPEVWQDHIVHERVLLNDAVCRDTDIVRAGDIVTYLPLPFEEPPANFNYSIVYEDEYLLGINKPAGLLVHRAGLSFTNNLISHLRHVHEPRAYPAADMINRIDRDTSGVVLVSKMPEFCKLMRQLIAQGAMDKLYHAVVAGIVQKSVQIVDASLRQDKTVDSPVRIVVDAEKGKPSQTQLSVVRTFARSATLLAIVPLQGRTHQIRVHCAHIGHPILGDRTYGGEFGGDLEFNRQALHCSEVRFIHPTTGNPTVITAPLSEDIAQFIDVLDPC